MISDSAPAAAPNSDAVHYGLEREGEAKWGLTVEADREWLGQPARVWPAHIDPTLTVPSPSLDCYIVNKTSAGHGCGSGGWQALNAKAKYDANGLSEYGRSLLRFDTSPIPSSAYVAEASLGLFSPSAVKNTSGVQIWQLSKSWSSAATWANRENGVPWTKAGGDYTTVGSEILTSQRGSQAGPWVFTEGMIRLVREWVSGMASNQGVVLKLSDETKTQCSGGCIERLAEFQSSAAADSTKRPYLKVIYYPAAKSSSKVVSPGEGTRTARRLKLKAAWETQGVTGVTFQFKPQGVNGSSEFATIPSSLVTNAKGEAVSWPLAVGGQQQSEPVFFDAAHADPSLLAHGGPVVVRALFDGSIGASGYSAAVTTSVDRFVGGTRDATAPLGPGTVNLLTGNFTIGRTDVSISGFGSALEFSRTHASRRADYSSVLGAGWQPSVPVEAAGGAAWQKVREFIPSSEEAEIGIGTYAVLTDLEGYEYAFELTESGYVSPPEAAGWILSREDGTHLALTDPGGNRTVFKKEESGADYLPASVSQTGGPGNSTRMVYELVGGKQRLKEIIAPTPAGVSCTDTNATVTVGCRVLTFSYLPATNWGAPSSLGDRLAKITYWAWGTTGTMAQWDVAKYEYDTSGRLTQEWDPRISPNLKESYTYTSGGQVATLAPSGEEPWTFSYYGTYDGEEANGRLANVQRPSLLASPSIAQTTIVYGVPVSGGGGPYDMSGTAVAKWGQQDVPLDATAIFSPDEVPGSPPSSYARATVYYMDAEGQLVNTATPSGAGTEAPSITTVEPDEHGNVVRELTAQNRLRALAAGANSVAKSHELETKRNFSADGTEMLEEWGPLHEVRLESGETAEARMHKTVEYDGGAPTPPAGTPQYHLPTRETVGASVAGKGIDADQRVTETKYNWTLRKPTDSIVDPQGLNLRTHIEYDAESGLPIERRLPANPEGGDAHTTKTLYYTAGAHPSDSSCANKPAWANLPCKALPAKQPGTEGQPELLVTRYLAYNQLGQPTEVSESPGGTGLNPRVTQTGYDAAGRPTSSVQTGNGAQIPKAQVLYSATTGRPTTQRFLCEGTGCEGFDNQATTTAYDILGRPLTYEDADGNLSSVSYDLLGRPVTTSDGKGIQTRTYDPTSGLLVKLEDSGAGSFTASYDADGNMVEQGLPNGLLAKTTYDGTGAPVHLSYEKKTFCSIGCTWLDFDVEHSITGQVLAQTSNLSAQQYSYDKAGRLTLVKDTPQGGGCTTRSYSFDKDSNRTALVTRAPGIGGACDTASAGTIQNYSHDATDRLLGTGMIYDNYGRITSLPASYAGGSTLTTTYYSNDLIKSQSQGGITNTYELDSALRQRKRTQTGGSEPGTEVYHYAGGSDSPAWIDRGSTWSRSVVGIDGSLAAIQDSAKGTTLQLTNLRGDVVATASTNPETTKLLATFEFDEFGNPKQSGGAKYGWLGGKQRRTELPSGVIQMGVRSYVPAMGRFISTDPVMGGSANTYDYANVDPVNGFDLDGLCAKQHRCKSKSSGQGAVGNRRAAVARNAATASKRKLPRLKGTSLGPCQFRGAGVNLTTGDTNVLTASIAYSCSEETAVAGYLKIPIGYAGPRPLVGPISSGDASERGILTMLITWSGPHRPPILACLAVVSDDSSETTCFRTAWVG